jgi:hypothetical protein
VMKGEFDGAAQVNEHGADDLGCGHDSAATGVRQYSPLARAPVYLKSCVISTTRSRSCYQSWQIAAVLRACYELPQAHSGRGHLGPVRAVD